MKMATTGQPLVPRYGRYAVKCDDCKTEIGRTDSMGVSAAGGRCEACRLLASAATMNRTEALAYLARPVLLPEAATFGDVFATSHRRTFGTPHMFPPRGGGDPNVRHRIRAANEVGPYCSVAARGARWSMDVVANDAVMAAVTPQIVTPDDALSFQIIEHEQTGFALVVLQHGYIIGSHWVAYIDPATIPYRPVAS